MYLPHDARLRLVIQLAYALALATVFSAGSCERDAEPAPEPEPPVVTTRDNVDEQLWTYFDRYEAEAERRGIAVDLGALQLTAAISEIVAEGVAGECTYDPAAPNRLVVDEGLWDSPTTSDQLREYVVFHELGHCERLRAHREDQDGDGVCVSLMASGTEECRPSYNDANREAVLDELFNEAFYGDAL